MSMTVTQFQRELIVDIERGSRFLKNHEHKTDSSLKELLTAAGVKYHSFYGVVRTLKARNQLPELARLAFALQEVNVLPKVKDLHDVPLEGVRPVSAHQEPPHRIHPQEVDDVTADDDFDALTTVIKTLRKLPRQKRERVLSSAQVYFDGAI